MTLGIVVISLALVLVTLMVVYVINAEEVEKHDEAVRMRWAEARKSEPPEWADPEKWWESEGVAVGRLDGKNIAASRIADDAVYCEEGVLKHEHKTD